MSRPRLLFILLAIVPASYSLANLQEQSYYPQNFLEAYQQDELKDEKLKESLYEILSSYHVEKEGEQDKIQSNCEANDVCFIQRSDLSYKEARTFLFGELHLEKKNGKNIVRDVYCNHEYGKESGVGEYRIPNPNVINCEHTWPQSKFNKSQNINTQKTDLHHLYPVYSPANSTRSNHNFGMVNGRSVSSSCTDSSKGTIIGTSIVGFQPPPEHRGNVARALFYFSVRFKIDIPEYEEKFLRQWNTEDPVDEFERARNEAIFKIQKNRNPFIDDQSLVSKIKDF